MASMIPESKDQTISYIGQFKDVTFYQKGMAVLGNEVQVLVCDKLGVVYGVMLLHSDGTVDWHNPPEEEHRYEYESSVKRLLKETKDITFGFPYELEVGDLVYASFFEGILLEFYGKVQKDETGLFINTGKRQGEKMYRRGYLEDAHEVRKAELSKGYICFPRAFSKREMVGVFLVCAPTFQGGGADWENCNVPEISRIEEEDANELREIAERLGCEIY